MPSAAAAEPDLVQSEQAAEQAADFVCVCLSSRQCTTAASVAAIGAEVKVGAQPPLQALQDIRLKLCRLSRG